MDIIISNKSDQPIYEQIYTAIKQNIIAGKLKEGDALPSIRNLAKDLRISVITTKRAYDELEKDGYIYTVASKGCFVPETNMTIIREEYLKQIEEHMREILTLGRTCGLSYEELENMFKLMQQEE